ncbi:lysophospholipid acyltransferase family protein [Roseovarius ramblicola]|uniref:Lysophospholipid acyltransferase family protein n=1 Tax=Roseovarius ramblicola TaxID=2022336 RepID=A0ABV5I416_9RHOB
MSVTWHSPAPRPAVARAPGHWRRVAWRGARIALVIGAGVLATLLLRPVERPVHGMARPWTQPVTVWVCRRVLVILRIAHEVAGTPMEGPGAVVANHVSWLDIFALNARKRVYFVSKAEVAGWPGIGFLARLVGTVFITRDPRAARAHTALLQARLAAGQRLLFFPEGTSTDGMRVRPFKTTLFEALCAPGTGLDGARVQPVTLVYEAPEGTDPRVYGWWGDMAFASHLLTVLGMPRQGRVRVVCHTPVPLGEGRKALAAACEAAVRAGMPEDRRGV